jgi:hypothetical protein
MSMQEDIREHNALVVAKNQRDNAIAEVEMTYLTQGVHIVARKLGFLTKADVQALEENVNRMILAQNEALSKKVEELSTRLEELEHAFLEDANNKRLDLHAKGLEDLNKQMQERIRVNVQIMTRVDTLDSLVKALSPERLDTLFERVGKTELVLGALGRVLVPNS